MNNPNHPNYFTDNVHLLNNMSMLLGAASTGQADHNKPLQQIYQYTNVNAVHPMNLATTTSQPSVVAQTTTIDPVALVYQHQQDQAILLQQHQQQQQQQQQQQHQHYMMASEETQSHQPPASQPLYHSNYVADLAPDYIQPYHIFQVTSLRSQLSEADSVTLFRWTSQSVTAEVNRSTILHISVQAGPRSTSLHQSASLVSTETGSQTGRPSTVSTTSSRNVASVCPRRVTVATNKPVTSVHSTTHHYFGF